MRGAVGEEEAVGAELRVVHCLAEVAAVPVSGLERRASVSGRPLEGWRVASKRLRPLPRIGRGALGRGYGGKGSGALPLAWAAGVGGRRVNRLVCTRSTHARARRDDEGPGRSR